MLPAESGSWDRVAEAFYASTLDRPPSRSEVTAIQEAALKSPDDLGAALQNLLVSEDACKLRIRSALHTVNELAADDDERITELAKQFRWFLGREEHEPKMHGHSVALLYAHFATLALATTKDGLA